MVLGLPEVITVKISPIRWETTSLERCSTTSISAREVGTKSVKGSCIRVHPNLRRGLLPPLYLKEPRKRGWMLPSTGWIRTRLPPWPSGNITLIQSWCFAADMQLVPTKKLLKKYKQKRALVMRKRIPCVRSTQKWTLPYATVKVATRVGVAACPLLS